MGIWKLKQAGKYFEAAMQRCCMLSKWMSCRVQNINLMLSKQIIPHEIRPMAQIQAILLFLLVNM
jgi:hypothetical protein